MNISQTDRFTKINESIENYIQLIKDEYPELYQFLDESPLNLPVSQEAIKISELNCYLQELKDLYASYKKNHS